jgi:RND family efflux transporter MFP subunit
MNASGQRQRQRVLVASLSLTALLAGGIVGGLAVWGRSSRQLGDPEFLRAQLARVSEQEGGGPAGPPPALVRVDVVQRKTVQPQRAIVGRLVEVRKATVASEVTGKIVDMPVEEGTEVVGGETLLAQVDDVWGQLALKRSRAQVASTEAKLRYELLELDRSRELRDRNALSRSEFEAREATVAELQARLDEAKAAVEEESERVLRSAIIAPFDGTVVAKLAEVGQHVAPGTPLVEIVSRGEVDARLMVPESAVNLIHLDQLLPIRIDPLGEEARGQVVSVTPYGPMASRTFPVRVRLDDQDGRLKVGMSVTAMVGVGPPREALVVTKDAVLVRPDGSTIWVTVSDGAAAQAEVQPVPVTITARMPDEYAVEPETDPGRDLLREGTSVVIEGAERLTPGQQVRIVTLEAGLRATAGRPGAALGRQEG